MAKKKAAFKPPHPKWDLYKDGVSQSLLAKFINCRERFRLYAVEGLRPTDRKEAMEFGTIFHKALEYHAQKMTTSQINTKLMKWAKDNPKVDKALCRIATAILPHYIDEWKEEKLEYVASEEIFDVPYIASNGKTVRLRGRRDEMFVRNGLLWLQENKTKTNIDEDKIMACLPEDLQTMLYVYTAGIDYHPRKMGGVLYNVIRKPSLKQGAKETESQFLKRISDDCADRRDHYFKRYDVELTQNDIDSFMDQILDPHITALVEWWESVKHNPFDPWRLQDGERNPHHWRRPFGIFDPMTFGKGDYFELIVSGSHLGLETVETAFPELANEEQGVN
jgi:hypothetical protein